MTKLAPEWVRTSDPVIRSPARYRWTTAPALPKLLETVLVSLSNDNNIRSWSIYNDKDGSISLRIKFVPEEESISRDRQTTNAHYTRKSERKAMRDRQ